MKFHLGHHAIHIGGWFAGIILAAGVTMLISFIPKLFRWYLVVWIDKKVEVEGTMHLKVSDHGVSPDVYKSKFEVKNSSHMEIEIESCFWKFEGEKSPWDDEVSYQYKDPIRIGNKRAKTFAWNWTEYRVTNKSGYIKASPAIRIQYFPRFSRKARKGPWQKVITGRPFSINLTNEHRIF